MSLDDDKTLSRGEEFLQIFKKGAEFTQELLKENERLRYLLLQRDGNGQNAVSPSDLAQENLRLLRRIEQLEREKEEILGRVKQVELENQDFAARYVDVEEENNNLANLYIASFQLHSTLDFQEVLQTITEIVINLIGAEEFAVMLLDEKEGVLAPVVAEGLDLADIPRVRPGEGLIGRVAQTGESYFVDDPLSYRHDAHQPMVCIPLKIKDSIIGVILVYKLLVQKGRFVQVDYELFSLLAGHAATAIFSSRLYTQSERKLSTFQGFIDLLISK